jgi:hypothetical protein
MLYLKTLKISFASKTPNSYKQLKQINMGFSRDLHGFWTKVTGRAAELFRVKVHGPSMRLRRTVDK